MTQAQRKEVVDPVSKVAEAAIKEAGGEVLSATKIMAARVRKSDMLYRALMDRLVDEACYSAIRGVVRGTREDIWTAPNYDKGGNGNRVEALASGNSLMYFPLPGGKYLCQATRAEVEEAASFYRKQSDDMGHKARWLSLVAAEVEGRKTVGGCLSEDALQKLKEGSR